MSNDTIEVFSSTKTVCVGVNLFVSLVTGTAVASAGFPEDTLLLYDMELCGLSLQALSLLDGPQGINYPMPSVIIPSEPTAVLHASCFKPHGQGTDAVESLDLILRDEQQSSSRPSALFLTGDQIYADDVERDLLLHIIASADHLVGLEKLPGLAEVPGRKTLLASFANMTSGHAARPCNRFSELSIPSPPTVSRSDSPLHNWSTCSFGSSLAEVLFEISHSR